MRTGSVNQHIPTPTGSTHNHTAAIPGAVPPPMTQPTNTSATHAAFEKLPTRQSKNLSKQFSTLFKNVGQDSIRSLLISSLAFFLLFLILATTKLYNDHQRYKRTETSNYQSEIVSKASNAKRAIDSEIAWMDTALSINGSPHQIINFVERGRHTNGAALIDASGSIMAATQPSGKELAKISRRNIPKNGVQLSSLIVTSVPIETRPPSAVWVSKYLTHRPSFN